MLIHVSPIKLCEDLTCSQICANIILIDDTQDIIQMFNAAGGIGILHKEIGNTLMMLEKLLEVELNT